MFEPTLPMTPAEWLPLIAPLLTLLIGLAYFLRRAACWPCWG